MAKDVSNEIVIDPAATVRETMAQLPQTKDVFSRFGVDTCCGSGIPIVDAARRDGADLESLLAALSQATSSL